MEPLKPLPSPPKSAKSTGSPKRKTKMPSVAQDEEEEFEFFHEFTRSKVKDLIHNITLEIKTNGLDIEYLFLPFRPEQSNEKLLKFLNQTFPLGNGSVVSPEKQIKIIKKSDPWTIFQALKYTWCRLPDGEVIGWKAYKDFREREKNDGYPSRSFLDLMPKCLSSPDHASIVYDFFDLIVTMASNSKNNKMSARKISKMFAIWAFGKDSSSSGDDYDFDHLKSNEDNNSFNEGLEQWLPASDAMFHLLLSFIRSFVPNDLKSANIPLVFKSILFNNDYPPKGSTAYASETILTVPLVSLKTTTFSKKPWQLIERCNALFDFSNYEAFEAREDYALLKSLFKKKRNIEGISHKMSHESKRLMKAMSTKHSTFQAGWAKRKCLPSADKTPETTEHLEMKRVDIDDYFIWAWLSTLSYEQTSQKRKIFGRSLILEFEFDGFKKWVILEECDLNSEMKNHRKMDTLDFITKTKATPEIPTQRNVTPMYEKFQKTTIEAQKTGLNNDSQQAVQDRQPSGYHTVIDPHNFHRDKTKGNVSLHAIEQKISKWNPLNSIRKRSSGSNSSSSLNTPSLRATSSSYDEATSKNLPPDPSPHLPNTTIRKQHESRVLSEYSLLKPEKFKLPPIEKDDFRIDLPLLDQNIAEADFTTPTTEVVNDSSRRDSPLRNAQDGAESYSHALSPRLSTNSGVEDARRSHSPVKSTKSGIEDLSEMVDELTQHVMNVDKKLANSVTSVVTNEETFESLTMFDRYKDQPKLPKHEDESPTELLERSAASSVVQPLKLDSEKQTLESFTKLPPHMQLSGEAIRSDYSAENTSHESSPVFLRGKSLSPQLSRPSPPSDTYRQLSPSPGNEKQIYSIHSSQIPALSSPKYADHPDNRQINLSPRSENTNLERNIPLDLAQDQRHRRDQPSPHFSAGADNAFYQPQPTASPRSNYPPPLRSDYNRGAIPNKSGSFDQPEIVYQKGSSTNPSPRSNGSPPVMVPRHNNHIAGPTSNANHRTIQKGMVPAEAYSNHPNSYARNNHPVNDYIPPQTNQYDRIVMKEPPIQTTNYAQNPNPQYYTSPEEPRGFLQFSPGPSGPSRGGRNQQTHAKTGYSSSQEKPSNYDSSQRPLYQQGQQMMYPPQTRMQQTTQSQVYQQYPSPQQGHYFPPPMHNPNFIPSGIPVAPSTGIKKPSNHMLPPGSQLNAPGMLPTNRLHGGNATKGKDRKMLYNTIKNGDFGI